MFIKCDLFLRGQSCSRDVVPSLPQRLAEENRPWWWLRFKEPHESIFDPAPSRTAKDCHIRRWLIRWHNMTHWYRAAFFLTLTRRSRGDSRTTCSCSWTYETATTSRCCSATWHSCLRALAQAQYPVVVGTSGARAPLQRRKELNIIWVRISYYPRYTCLTCATPA